MSVVPVLNGSNMTFYLCIALLGVAQVVIVRAGSLVADWGFLKLAGEHFRSPGESPSQFTWIIILLAESFGTKHAPLVIYSTCSCCRNQR
jgi:hypothetical protein